jgi:hypothetical protein
MNEKMNEKSARRKFMAKGDLLFLLCLAGGLFALYFFTTHHVEDGEKYAEISVDGQVDAVFAMSGDETYVPACRPAVRIAVRGGAVGFVHSDCQDKICIHSGFLSTPGQSAVCLPNKVVLRVAVRKGEALDSVTY